MPPDRQRDGIGTALVAAAVEGGEALVAPALFLEGSPPTTAPGASSPDVPTASCRPVTGRPARHSRCVLYDTHRDWMSGRLVYRDVWWQHDSAGLRGPGSGRAGEVFRATLEEVAEADLVVHVIDAAATDRDRRITAVGQVLDEVGATEVPMLAVYNKCDQLTIEERRRLQEAEPDALCISALTREGVDELVETITSRLALDVRRLTIELDANNPADRERIARIYRHARVLVHEARDGRVSIVADVPRRVQASLGL